MKESLIRRWVCVPWHSWIKDEAPWCELLAELLSRLPVPALEALVREQRPLIVLPPVQQGRITQVSAPLTGGACILQLDERLLSRPKAEALGILAHELAHVCTSTPPVDDALANDLDADRLATQWGFGHELGEALRADLASDHPRVLAASKLAA